MGTGYTRNDTGNNIADGNVINASDLDGEYNAIEAAFNASTGHTHDGTSAEGAPIEVAGPAQDLVITATEVRPKTDNTLDLGTNTLEFKDLYLDGTANIDSLVADTADINAGSIDGVTLGTNSAVTSAVITTADINGGTIDSTTIGGSTPAAGSFTTITGSGDMNIDSNTLFVDVSTDRVGIGTSSPSYDLDIQSTGSAQAQILSASGSNAILRIQNAGTTDETKIYFGDSGDSDVGELIYNHNDDSMRFNVNASEAMRIDSSGQVGIGETNPQQLLHLNNNANNSARIRLENNDGDVDIATDGTDMFFVAGGSEVLRVESDGHVGIGTTSPATMLHLFDNTANSGPVIRLHGSGQDAANNLLGGVEIFNDDSSGDGPTNVCSIKGFSFGGTGSGGYLTFSTHDGSEGGEGSSPVERMRIDSSGNVGIGTTSPSYQVTIETAGGSGGTASGAADNLVIDGGGAANHGISILAGSGYNSSIYMGDESSSIQGYVQYNHPSDYMRFATDGTERMRINSDGQVLIDTSSALTSVPSVQVGDADVASSSGDDGVFLNSDGALRVVTDTPSACFFNDSSSSAGTHNYILFRYQGSTIGDIDSTDNSTVRYNTFTGGHWTQFEDGTQPDLPSGTVLSTIDDMLQWTEYEYTNEDGQTEKTDISGHDTIGSTKTIYIDEDGATAEGTALSHDTAQRIAKCKVSDVEGDKCVYGVFAGHYKDGDSSVESLGLGLIRIGSGVTVQRGDLLESAGDGTARPQTGDTADLFKAGTIAKVTSTTVVETYDDGSYTVPCTLHCG